MIVNPGRPAWGALTAFASSMVSLFGMDQFHVATFVDVSVNFGGALVVSLFVTIAVYGQAKIAEINKRNGAQRT